MQVKISIYSLLVRILTFASYPIRLDNIDASIIVITLLFISIRPSDLKSVNVRISVSLAVLAIAA